MFLKLIQLLIGETGLVRGTHTQNLSNGKVVNAALTGQAPFLWGLGVNAAPDVDQTHKIVGKHDLTTYLAKKIFSLSFVSCFSSEHLNAVPPPGG